MKRFTIFTVTFIAVFALQLNAQITLDLKVFLEGPFNGTAMNTTLNAQNLIPLSQPYNVTPWNYDGNEQVSAIPNTGIVDWVLVELRETTGGASTATPDKMIDRQAAFIKADGSIVGTNGSSMIIYSGSVTGNLFVIIWHRSHLAIMSSAPLTNAGGIYLWDFTNLLSKAYLEGQKEIGAGVFGLITGDSDGSGAVFTSDIDPKWSSNAGRRGYYSADLNLDCHVNNKDKNTFWDSNYNLWTKIPVDNLGCGSVLIDQRDFQNYNTVQIGTQCWMAKNINVGVFIGGSADQSNFKKIEKYCYDNNTSNCDIYGGLYQWNEMMQFTTQVGSIGICPIGWHIPSDDEWTLLTDFLGGTAEAGGKMKEAGNLHWFSPNYGATNESDFTAIPGGYHDHAGYFNSMTFFAYFGSSTEINLDNAWGRDLYYGNSSVNVGNDNKNEAFSVRCLKDESPANQPPSIPSSPQPTDGATNQPINATLSWACTDPDNDPLTYDVYFGISNPPSLISSGQADNIFNPGSLSYSTTYYWKIITHDDHSNSTEGEVWIFTTENQPFTCGEPLLDSRDGQSYNTFQIGTQCWMAENLNIGTMIQGSTGMTNNSIIEKNCYENNTVNCDTYGGIYEWNEMMQYTTTPGVQGICPTGWHLPTDAEWCILTQFIDPTVNCNTTAWSGTDVGTKMKSTTGWYQGGNGTNTSGFTAIPGGLRNSSGSFFGLSGYAYFLSSTEYDTYDAWNRRLYFLVANVDRDSYSKTYGFSVRCLKD